MTITKTTSGNISFPTIGEIYQWWVFDLTESNFTYAIRSSQHLCNITNELGIMFMTIADKFSEIERYKNYSYDLLEDMKGDAVLQMCRYYNKIDLEKCSSAFRYFAAVTDVAFGRTIEKSLK